MFPTDLATLLALHSNQTTGVKERKKTVLDSNLRPSRAATRHLLQAQRDYFGAHTYERVDKPRGEFFHTNWTGTGGRVASSTYTV